MDTKYYDALVKMGQWQLHSGGYAYRQIRVGPRRLGKRQQIYMHREVLRLAGIDLTDFVDHRNRRKLDNRRRNLRPATNAQNQYNRRRRRSNKTGHKGVYPHRQKYCAQIVLKGRTIYLGLYRTARAAGRAYDRAARRLFKSFCSH